jgi:hypothetical protein
MDGVILTLAQEGASVGCDFRSGETSVGLPMSIDRFVATGVTPVSLRPLITVGNPGAWSCLDIV